MELEISLGKVQLVYIYAPQGVLLMWVFRHSVAQCNINPASLNVRLIHSYGVTNEVYGMTHNV